MCKVAIQTLKNCHVCIFWVFVLFVLQFLFQYFHCYSVVENVKSMG